MARDQEVPSSNLGGGFFSMKSPDKNIKQNQSFFNKGAKRYDNPLLQFWMRRFHAPTIEELRFTSATKILDISCGTEELLKKLQGKAELYGIDISEAMLKVAKGKLGAQATLQKGDVHALLFQDRFFDYVITTEAFHHYYNQQKALQEISRVTKKEGKVIIVDVNFFLKSIHWLFKKLEPGHVKINSRKEMKYLFKESGLRILTQKRSFLFAIMTVGEKPENLL